MEKWALRITESGDLSIIAVMACAYLIGFSLGGIFSYRKKFAMGRGTYFLTIAILSVTASVASLIWLFTVDAVFAGVLWVLLGATILALGVLGFLCAAASAARSRDAFGGSGYFFLGTIPVANLILVFKSPKDLLSRNRLFTSGLLAGGPAVFAGLVLFVGGNIFDRWIEDEIDKLETTADQIEESDSLEPLLKLGGLEKTLNLMADNSDLPLEIEEDFVLKQLQADGTILRRTFIISDDTVTPSAELSTGILKETCSIDVFTPLFREGATIEEIYVRPDDSEIARVQVNRFACAAVAKLD